MLRSGQTHLPHYAAVINWEPSGVGMRLSEVRTVLANLREASCHFWVAGGWGVDALVERQTRPHRDLDVAVDAEHESAVVAVLSLLGYAVETDWRPVRVEFVAPNRGWVDLHPVAFDCTGHGRQAGLAGGHFDYRQRHSPTARWAGWWCHVCPESSRCASTVATSRDRSTCTISGCSNGC